MPIEAPAKVEKLRIEGYKESDYSDTENFVFQTAINPDKYVLGMKIELDGKKAINGNEGIQYVRTPPADMDFEFLFDSTGLIDSNVSFDGKFTFTKNPLAKIEVDASNEKETGVEVNIQRFLQVVYHYDGSIHRPNYLRIIWGTLAFTCLLSDLSIEYKLFAPDGRPLRAVVKAKFKHYMSEAKKEAEENKQSPDLTHVRVVEEGDTLPLMAQRIYGDSKYYLEVARANKITTFRKLEAGTRIYFPPIQKPG